MPEPGDAEHSNPGRPRRAPGRHRQPASPGRQPRRRWRGIRTWLTLTGAIVVMSLAAGLLAGVNPLRLAGVTSPGRLASDIPGPVPGPRPGGGSGPGARPGISAAGSGPGRADTARRPAPVTATPPGAPVAASSCVKVAQLGDSTSAGLVSAAYLPRKSQRLAAQYARVGIVATHLDISGDRSILRTRPGQQNATEVAARLRRKGYHGCWVLALGTNDTASVAAGSPVSRMARIRKLMAAIGNQPVMWVNLASQLGSGSYAEAGMVKWNATLLKACAAYPNMRVFNWAGVARLGWFSADGIHYTAAGYAARAKLIAGALATAFPPIARRPSRPSACLLS